MKTMNERFDKKFKCIDGRCDGHGNIPIQVGDNEWEAEQCQFHAEYLFPFLIFLQSEIDLAVAKREREIVERIHRRVDENSYIENYYDTAKDIITLITKQQ